MVVVAYRWTKWSSHQAADKPHRSSQPTWAGLGTWSSNWPGSRPPLVSSPSFATRTETHSWTTNLQSSYNLRRPWKWTLRPSERPRCPGTLRKCPEAVSAWGRLWWGRVLSGRRRLHSHRDRLDKLGDLEVAVLVLLVCQRASLVSLVCALDGLVC